MSRLVIPILIEMFESLQILTPFMLRRLKSDVDFVIPPKREVVAYAPLSGKQQEMYRCILDKTIAQLVGGPAPTQVNNISEHASVNQ
jgi:SNF2 family DNA or RNA helicase